MDTCAGCDLERCDGGGAVVDEEVVLLELFKDRTLVAVASRGVLWVYIINEYILEREVLLEEKTEQWKERTHGEDSPWSPFALERMGLVLKSSAVLAEPNAGGDLL